MFTLTVTWTTVTIFWILGAIGFFMLYTGMNTNITGFDYFLAITQAVVWPLAVPGVPITIAILFVLGIIIAAFGGKVD